jgi:ABC-type transporter Mla subunit MlaD
LISERRSLENAQQVLRTYRMVKSEMEPALQELRSVKEGTVSARRDLEAIEGQKANALARAREEVDKFRSEQLEQVEKEIAEKREALLILSKEHDALLKLFDEASEGYTKALRENNETLKKVKEELDQARSEHGVLAEAIAKAAGFFSNVQEKK